MKIKNLTITESKIIFTNNIQVDHDEWAEMMINRLYQRKQFQTTNLTRDSASKILDHLSYMAPKDFDKDVFVKAIRTIGIVKKLDHYRYDLSFIHTEDTYADTQETNLVYTLIIHTYTALDNEQDTTVVFSEKLQVLPKEPLVPIKETE